MTAASYGVREIEGGSPAASLIRRVGYAVVPPQEAGVDVPTIALAFDQARAAAEETLGRERLQAAGEGQSIRAPLLYDDALLALAATPAVRALALELLCPAFILNQQNGVSNPGDGETYVQGAWHRDLPYQHFTSSRPLAINALFCIEDFTVETGATEVLIASHKAETFPDEPVAAATSAQVLAPAGSFLVMDAMLYHRGGRNRSGRERRAVNHVYSIPFIRQQIQFSALAARDDLSPATRALLLLDDPLPSSPRDYLEGRLRKRAREA
ncbi:hypothetical protein BH09PSE2_BH09PSE2_02110 [soil metagenome]